MIAFWEGAGAVVIYLLIAASTAFALRFMVRIPDEWFRKGLHFILLGAYIPFVFAFQVWWHAALFALIIMLVAYPIIKWFEHFRSFTAVTTERKHGEFKNSLILAFSMMILCIAVTWGWLNDKLLGLASIYAWGVGDAFAALVGKRYGKHKIRLPGADPRKSVEGSAAMMITSAVAVMIVLLVRGGMPTGSCALIALAGAAVAALVELYTMGGYDTITCPAAAMLVILPLTKLLGGAV